jgi:puromycin-sensitive aminopeptidase
MSKRNDASQYQLPKNVVPKHYKIVERPNINTFLFGGTTSTTLDVLQPTDKIVLHARELKITDAYVVDSHGTRLNATRHQAHVTFIDPASGEEQKQEFDSAAALDHKAQTATFTFAGTLAPGEWTLVTEHEGSLVQPAFEGFHRCGYKDDAGNQKWALSTQFEATHARRAFPCWDEPALKATYDVTIEIDSDLEVLSNGRKLTKASETVDGGKKVVKFATTAKQSTYLLAWSIGEFESSEPVFVNGKEIRIWAVKGKKHLMSYALKCAAFGVKWFEKNLRVPYFGGDKIDLIAIPEFRSGAMENTGLITFRATALLVDELHATIAELQRVAEVVFHELAHQWFGNLVTMAWWDGLPLNESNATIFAYFVMAEWEPEWHIYDSFGLDRAGAFSLDSLKSTHPCWAPVGHPDEVEQRFDAITYEKGGSLEFQIQQFIGPAAFYKGCEIYLTRFNHGNAQVTDLWDAIEEGARASGQNVPVREIMDAWFLQDGHPVITVSESDKPGFVKLHQERFAFLGDESHAAQLWPIPLHLRYATADGTIHEEKFVFSGREQEVFLDKGFKYVVANAGGTGFFRVRYSQPLLDKLTATPFDTLKVIERFNLVNDSWALVRAQKLASDTYLGLVRQLAGENNPNVWSIVSGSLQTLHGLTTGEHRAAFKQLVRDLVKPVFSQLGWKPKEGESSATLELRGSLASLLGTIGEDTEVQLQASQLFESWKSDRNSVDPNVVPALVSTLAYTGDSARFDEFVALSKSAKTDQEKLRFLGALGKFRTPELYAKAIAMVLTEVKTDDAPYILGAFLGTEHAGEAAWDALRENWEKIVKRFPSSGTVRMIGGCSALDSDELQAEVVAFFAANKVAQGDMAVAQMLERLSVNVRLRQTETARLAAHLIPVAASPEPVKA